jgi:type IV pilus assembly protein PilY1
MDNGTYMFHFDVRDCSGLLTRASKIYYFTIAAPDDARWKEFSSRVASSSDDGMEQTNTGEIILCNGINALTLLDIDLGRDDDYYGGTSCLRACACNEAVLSAMRFTGVTVPSEVDGVPVTLENAYIEFTARESSGRTMFRNAALKLTITAQAADNPPTLGTSDYNISDRPDTVASVAWNVPEGAWISGQTYMTPDIKPIIQELINRPGWQDGNAMLFKIEAGLEDGGRVAHSFESNFNLAPRLVIKYSACE